MASSGSRYLAPTTAGRRNPQDNGNPKSDMIAQPPRYAEIGGLTSASKTGKRHGMAVRKPGSTIHK